MIVSNLQHTAQLERLHPLFKTLFDYVQSHDLLNAPLGRIILDGDNLFINNVATEGISRSVQVLEMHRQYIDVHFLLKGKEQIGWKALEDLKDIGAYSAEKDCALSKDKPSTWVTLTPGQFMIVGPEDPHAPVVGRGAIRKLVAKIRVS